MSVRARRCPNCTGLMSESITGELTDLPSLLVTCLECGKATLAAAWALGVWTEEPPGFPLSQELADRLDKLEIGPDSQELP